MPKRPRDSAPADPGPAYRELLGRVAGNVIRLRKAAGLTQEETAHRAGLTTRVYVRVEHQETNFSASTLVKVAVGLEVDVGELLSKGRARR